jgi:hypothetical protein
MVFISCKNNLLEPEMIGSWGQFSPPHALPNDRYKRIDEGTNKQLKDILGLKAI